MNIFKRARVIYILHRHPITHTVWDFVSNRLALLQGMSAVEMAHLRELTTLFLHDKNIFGAQDFQLNQEMRVFIAAQACLPVLGLGIALFNGWRDVVVYPDAFQVNRDERDEFGIVHRNQRLLSGESWSRGPVILSWHDIERDIQNWQHGHNVVIHEIAHKLDTLNGSANGMPPLHYAMHPEQWSFALSAAYDRLNQRLEHHHGICIDAYAATSPAEFFAVFSEYFFCAPEILQVHFAAVYQQLKLYYRQDPLQRRTTTAAINK